MKNRLTIIKSVVTNEYFYSIDHCQPMDDSNWVPCSLSLPHFITPREGFENGILETFKDYDRFESMHGTRIDNPDPRYSI